jgi:hypothetical protein
MPMTREIPAEKEITNSNKLMNLQIIQKKANRIII